MAFRRRTKSYPLFSQEFIIHNHADICFCLLVCVLLALMFEIQSDDVEPFSLDQDFDYDRVVLTPKFPTSEMKAMTGLTVQVGPGTVD